MDHTKRILEGDSNNYNTLYQPPLKQSKSDCATTNGLLHGDSPSHSEKVDGKDENEEQKEEDTYFRGYSHITIHRDMIADHVRTSTYRNAILANAELLRGKVVADIGAGTGILSMFCVQAGAKKVYAIEASNIAKQAKLVIAANSMQDQITVIHSKLEDVALPEKVDVIVSEWMGYCLLYESMLNTVLEARDKWLKPDGVMLPDKASIYLAPHCDSESYDADLDFWEDVQEQYYVDMAAMRDHARTCLTQSPHIRCIDAEDVMSHAARICALDLLKISLEELQEIRGSFDFRCFGHSRIYGFVSWFSVEFPQGIRLSTSPYDDATHWSQCVFFIDQPFNVQQDSTIYGEMVLCPSKINQRFLECDIIFRASGEPDSCIKQHYLMDDMTS